MGPTGTDQQTRLDRLDDATVALVDPLPLPLDTTRHEEDTLAHVDLLSPIHSTFDAAAALRDPSLSLLHHSAVTSPAPAILLPHASPLTPVTSAFTHAPNFFTHNGSASSLTSAALLDMLNPSAIERQLQTTHHPLALDQTHMVNNHDEGCDDDDHADDDDVDDEDASPADLARAPPAASSGSAAAHLSGSDSEDDEDYQEEEEDGTGAAGSDEDDSSSDMGASTATSGGLLEWVEHSQRSGVDPTTVLTRLLADYGHLPLPSKFLWRAAYNLTMHIQSHLVRASQRRRKLPHVNTLDDVCGLIRDSRKIVVLTGAGISVSAGIPDFRSKGGIYPRLKREFGMESPEAMFDLDYFRANPQIFYSFAKELWPGAHQPTTAHRFIAMLEREGKLLRNYTQNIDALETRAGIKNVLQCHGSFATAKCMTCERIVHGRDIHKDIMDQTIAKCTECWPVDGPVPDFGDDPVDRTFGVMKPEIVFFGESLPESFRTCLEADREEADLVIVMGSSLKVQPVAGMLEIFPKDTPMILINREVVGQPDEFDVEVLGLADDVCAYLAEKLDLTLPEVDPAWNTFEETTTPLEVRKESEATPVTADTSLDAADVDLPASTPALLSGPSLVTNVSLASPRPPSPTFVTPNRYLFRGSHVPTAPMTPSTYCDSMAEESLSSSTRGDEDDEGARANTRAETDEPMAADDARTHAASPSSTPREPQTTDLHSPSRSPRISTRPPPLQVDAHPTHEHIHARRHDDAIANGHREHAHGTPFTIGTVCTPTKSPRRLIAKPTPVHIGESDVPPHAYDRDPHCDARPSKRKSGADALTDFHRPPADAALPDCDFVFQPTVKRRKVSVEESKQSEEPITHAGTNTGFQPM